MLLNILFHLNRIVVKILVFESQVAKANALPELGAVNTESGMSEVERGQYKAYKELKQRIERERQLAIVQVNGPLGLR